MNRSWHGREAERLLALAHTQFKASQQSATQARVSRDEAHWNLKAAQVHATLATVDLGAEPETEQAAPAAHPTPGLGQPGPHDDRPKPGPPMLMPREVRK